MDIQPVNLTGRTVRLEPLTQDHIPDLAIAGRDESIWGHMLYGMVTNEERMRQWVLNISNTKQQEQTSPLRLFHLEIGHAIGSTRYMEIHPDDRGLEIGGTWYGVKYQRTGVNTECKYLHLQHAFEVLGCIRVQFKTDFL